MNNILNQMNYVYKDIRSLTPTDINTPLFIRARVHNSRNKGNFTFLVLRYQSTTLQAIGMKNTLGDDIFKSLTSITNESIIDCYGTLQLAKVKTCSYHDFELVIDKYELVSKANDLPFQLDDANNTWGEEGGKVNMDTRLNHRWVDLRTPMNNTIFKLQSYIGQYFRQYLLKNNFIEIHSPKIIGVQSEGGSQVFEMKYFDKPAFLAQSPQLYKQMAINADFDRVFEIGPVFRAENSFTNRHLCEFIGLDVEMALTPCQTYREIQILLWNLVTFIYDQIKQNHSNELQAITFNYPVYPKDPLIISFAQCVKMLNDIGFQQHELEDLSTVNEKKVGELVKDKYGSDLFIIDQYPLNVRPFYTMPSDDIPYSNSFDMILKGVEICSGSQRVHDYQMLMTKVAEKGINTESLKYYLESFSHGSRPHCGFGLGLERLVSLFLDIGNVKLASLCPRDPKRLFV
ncbi:aspartyl-tRNA synthetase [Klosneuvirus KNV1]|uniref:Aspartyl-tRNA synthetase n=1 Tax=Klosneuvirus KNV1 TaxID=1977640 RepID=A0A1V0SJ84_9VIRU|nr:aspartyl-tRNA synthetase [Klosneuvirus KNV1]